MNTNYGQSPAFTGTLKFAKAYKTVNNRLMGITKELEIDANDIKQVHRLAPPDIKDNSTLISLKNGLEYIVDHPSEKVSGSADKLKNSSSIEYFA